MKKIVSLPVVAILATFLVATQSQKSEAATIIHDYTLNNTFTDTLGGPALVGNGGTLTSTGYVFAPNQGLSLSLPNSVNTSNYSILIDFNIVNIGYYRKLVDFKELSSDNGFYSFEGALNFYSSQPVATGPGNPITPNTNVRVALTRDSATSEFAGYINGIQQFSFNDVNNDAVFNGPNNMAWFFRDDVVTGTLESSTGFVDRIRFYDGVLSSSEVGALQSNASAVPVPPQFLATMLGAGLGALKLRRQKKVDPAA
jgi:hypothetical protein